MRSVLLVLCAVVCFLVGAVLAQAAGPTTFDLTVQSLQCANLEGEGMIRAYDPEFQVVCYAPRFAAMTGEKGFTCVAVQK